MTNRWIFFHAFALPVLTSVVAKTDHYVVLLNGGNPDQVSRDNADCSLQWADLRRGIFDVRWSASSAGLQSAKAAGQPVEQSSLANRKVRCHGTPGVATTNVRKLLL